MLSEIDQKNPIVRHAFEFALMVDAFCADLRVDKLAKICRILSAIIHTSKNKPPIIRRFLSLFSF